MRKKLTKKQWIKEATDFLVKEGKGLTNEKWGKKEALGFAEALTDPACSYWKEGYTPTEAVLEDLSCA